MKKTVKYLVMLSVSAIFLLFACGKDNNGEDDPIGEIPVALIDAAVSLEGGRIVQGDMPGPTGSLIISSAGNLLEGFLNTGFLLPFSTQEELRGLYLQFEDSEGNKSIQHYQLDFQGFKKNKPFGHLDKLPGPGALKNISSTAELYQFAVLVAFNEKMPTGNFCLQLSAYDNQGNVSEPLRYCVEVLPWGGNTSLAGEWILDRYDPPFEEDGTILLTCESGEEIRVNLFDLELDDLILTLNADGSYVEEYHLLGLELDEELSARDCMEIFGEQLFEINFQFLGHWAYNTDAGTFTMVAFAFKNLLDPSDDSSSPYGDFYLFGVEAEVIGGELVLTFLQEDENGNLYTQKIIFRSTSV